VTSALHALIKVVALLFAMTLPSGCSWWQVPGAQVLFADGVRCYDGWFCITPQAAGEPPSLWIDFWAPVPYTFAFQSAVEGEAAGSSRQRLSLTVPQRRQLTLLPQGSGKQTRRLHWSFTVHPGNERATHDDAVVYQLPFAPGATHHLIQGYNGRFSHQAQSAYALDFAMPEGTPIHAARAGEVYLVRSDSRFRVKGQGNYVFVRHADGTFAQYLHLRPNGVMVQRGQQVPRGELLGYSGNTGYSTTPHLHFQVATPTPDGEHAYQTIPVRFRTRAGVEQLSAGMSYARPDQVSE
jgi:murein DD-endopeptidase MepM/ murein hydrolase activator NlpD